MYRKGIVAGSFDVIHLGYIKLFESAAQECDELIVLLHADPTTENKNKIKPIHTVIEREEILSSIVWVDTVIAYSSEQELFDILKNYVDNEVDVVRFLGDDYLDSPFTGDSLDIPIIFISREHEWSTTKYKKLISENYYESKNR